MKTTMWKRIGAAVAALALTAGLTSCGDDEEAITLVVIPGWTDSLSMAHLWKAVLEEDDYNVEIEEIADAPLTYTSLDRGDVDVYPSAWPEVTHASLVEKYPDLEDLGAYYGNAKLTFAVPEYSQLKSIADLKGKGDDYDGEIVGIEKGAGLTKMTKESVIPEYDLGDEYTLKTSSTATMLLELERAIEKKQEIVVTLWRPFWANTAFPVRDLEDPKGALGESEGLHEVARPGFSDDYEEVADMMTKAELTDEQYGDLEDLVVNQYKDDPAKGAEKWLEENPEWVDSLK